MDSAEMLRRTEAAPTHARRIAADAAVDALENSPDDTLLPWKGSTVSREDDATTAEALYILYRTRRRNLASQLRNRIEQVTHDSESSPSFVLLCIEKLPEAVAELHAVAKREYEHALVVERLARYADGVS